MTSPAAHDIYQPCISKKSKNKTKARPEHANTSTWLKTSAQKKAPRQRLILNLGSLDIPPDKYKELANCIEAMLSGQKTLFSQDPEVEAHARRAVSDIVRKQSEEQELAGAIDGETRPDADYQLVNVASFEASEP